MIYRDLFRPESHPLGLPDWQDGDIVEGGNLARTYNPAGPFLIDNGKKVLFRGVNLRNCITTIPSESCFTHCDTAPDPEPQPEPTEEEILAQRVAEKAFTQTDAMREALLKAAPIEATVGLYNSDGVERIKKAGE